MYILFMIMSEELALDDCRRIVLKHLMNIIDDDRPFSIFQVVEQIMVSMYPDEYLGMDSTIKKRREYMFAEVIWNLVLEKILTPRIDSANTNFQSLRITEFGKIVLSEEEIHPHDPYGYIDSLKAIPSVDPIILTYVEESLQAYLKNLLLSSAVTLGAASERGINVLLDTFISSTTYSRLKIKFSGLENKRIKTKHKGISDELNHIKNNFPPALKESYDCFFDGIFDIYRLSRNEAGHPTGNIVEKTAMFGYLTLFMPYCELIYDLIDYVTVNPL